MSKFDKPYTERVIAAIAEAMTKPQSKEDPFARDPLDHNPTRNVHENHSLILEDAETGLLYTVTVELL